MISENNKVSAGQIKKMLIFDIVSVSLIIIPGLSVQGAGRDGIFAIIIGSLAAILYGCFFLYISKKVDGDYFTFSKKVAGGFVTFLIIILYLTKFIFSCWFTLSLFCDVINKTLLPNTDYRIIIITFILTGVYMSLKGIEVRARVSELLFYIVIIPLFLILLGGVKNIEISNLFPLLTTEKNDMIKTAYLVLLSYSSLEFLLFALPITVNNESRENKYKKNIITVVIISMIINLLLFLLVLGILGISDAGKQFESSITILQMIEIPIGFVQRQDAVILMFWLFSIFTLISAYFYYLSKISMQLINKKSKYGYFAIYGIAIFLLCTIHLTPDKKIDYYMTYMSYVGLPQSVIIPLFILIIMKLKSYFRRQGTQIGVKVE